MQNSNSRNIKTGQNLYAKTSIIGISKEQSFDYFFRKYFVVLCFFAQSIIHNEEEAKDIVQECFYKLWISESLEKRKDSIKSFLYTMVRNSCITYLRRKAVLTKAISYLQKSKSNVECFDEIAFAELVRQVLTHIAKLPPKMNFIVKRYYLEGKQLGKIAGELSTTENAVGMLKQRAMKLLRTTINI